MKIQVVVKQRGKWIVKKEFDIDLSSLEVVLNEIKTLKSYGYEADIRVLKQDK